MDDARFIEAMQNATALIDSGEVTEEVLGDLDLSQALTAIAEVVSDELNHLTGLGDDPEANEVAMRQVMQNAAAKTFFAGLLFGRVDAAPTPPNTVMVSVPVEVLDEIGVTAIRGGSVTITLVADEEQ